MQTSCDDRLKALLESGRSSGYLTFSQVFDEAVNFESYDQFLLLLKEQGIELIDETDALEREPTGAADHDDERSRGTAPSVLARQELERKLNMSLAELELSVRATNWLESEGITTVRDLVIRTDEQLPEVRNFGETTLKEVKQQLTERGPTLRMKMPGRRQSRVRDTH